MKTLQEENIKELTAKVLDLVAKTSVELGHRADAKSMASLSISHKKKINEAIYKTETLNQKNVEFYQPPLKQLK